MNIISLGGIDSVSIGSNQKIISLFPESFQGSTPIAPSQIAVTATDDEANKVIISWGYVTGYPKPTFEVFRDSISIGNPTSSPFIDFDGVVDTVYGYKVVATNSEGFTEDTDSGVSTDVPANAYITKANRVYITNANKIYITRGA